MGHLTCINFPASKVEVCAGCGSLSHALRMNGFNGKEFDVSWTET